MQIKKYISQNENETMAFAKKLASKLKPNDCLALVGDFGAGKTTFVKGLACGLGFKKKNYVCSPSFVILKIYKARMPIFHFDLYRLQNLKDIQNIGLDECTGVGGVTVIEWAERLEGLLPENHVKILFSVLGPTKRGIKLIWPKLKKKAKKWFLLKVEWMA